MATDPGNDAVKSILFELIDDSEERVGYNALRILTHFQEELKEEIAMVEYGELSPGLLSSKRQTDRRIAHLKS